MSDQYMLHSSRYFLRGIRIHKLVNFFSRSLCDIFSMRFYFRNILKLVPTLIFKRFFDFKSIGNYELKRLSKQENFADHFIMKYATNLQDMFNITSAGCTERTGCVCGTAQYQDEICSFVEHNCTKELPCNDPITPMGHCCPFCGTYAHAHIHILCTSKSRTFAAAETDVSV